MKRTAKKTISAFSIIFAMVVTIFVSITILFIAKYVGSAVFSNENTTDEDTYYIINDISKDQKPIDLEYNTEDDDIHVHIWHSGIYSR